MTWNTKWLESDVLQTTQSGQVTLEEINDMIANIQKELENTQSPIFIVWDISEMNAHPTKLKEIMDAAQPILNHRGIAAIIFIGLKNPVVKFLTTVVSTIGKLRFHIANDAKGAELILDKLKSTYTVT